MAELCVVGVRHHSPACARVVAHVIATRRPTHVLIEGPSDFTAERMGELVLGHAPPLAIYSYALSDPRSRAVGVWSPFCAYSPEWVALTHGMRAGADVRFIDLPAWDEAFRDVENRYADRELAQHHQERALGESHGFDSSDSLWDHLFEDPTRPAEVAMQELETYFEGMRGDDPTSERDTRREAFMARWIAWAMGVSEGLVLVVCGGFHAPALRRLVSTHDEPRPAPPPLPPHEGRTGSYLVPFSMRRLDSFTGYASGMPSPGYYQAVWEQGAGASLAMLMRTAAALRARGQVVSTADLLAATELMDGLARLRGHTTPRRTDVLDAMAAAFIKDALTRPPPWTVRGMLPRGTDPILVEIVATFSGSAVGRLAPGTPRPPLIDDVEDLCAALGLAWDGTRQSLDPLDPESAPRREVLHRLLILEVPGVVREQRQSLQRGAKRDERWRLERLLETDTVLIERAVYGADLASAALARLQERVAAASGVADLVAALEDAVNAHYLDLAHGLTRAALEAIGHEPSLGALGLGLRALIGLAIAVGDLVDELIEAALDRAGWLLEGRDGVGAPLVREEVIAVAAMAGALRYLDSRDISPVDGPAPPGLLRAAARDGIVAVFHRRVASPQAPPWLKGACLGGLWLLDAGDEAMAAAALSATPDLALGDTLIGLLTVVREPLLNTGLLALIDTRLAALDEATFLAVLPSLRGAFAILPPPERLKLARRVASPTDAHALVAPLPDVDFGEVAALEARAFALLTRYGLLP